MGENEIEEDKCGLNTSKIVHSIYCNTLQVEKLTGVMFLRLYLRQENGQTPLVLFNNKVETKHQCFVKKNLND